MAAATASYEPLLLSPAKRHEAPNPREILRNLGCICFIIGAVILFNVAGPESLRSISNALGIGLNRKLGVMPDKKTDKWIVVTSIQYPTDDIKRLASLPEWTLVVVGDSKTPADWFLPDVHFLSVEKQKSLGFRSVSRLPTGSYTRKNTGYLYAIANGAQWIYDTDDDNKPFGKGLDQFDYTETLQGLRFHGSTNGSYAAFQDRLFNPYSHFGVHEMWPRGFPLEYIKEHTHKDGAYRLCNVMKAPAVQQGIVQKDPDVDAIYRLIHADPHSGLDEGFNRFAPSVLLAPGTYSPWNSQNTLFKRDAFFGLFLPTSVAFRVTDIWRSFFTQALLHLVGEVVSFVPVNAIQQRNAHSYLGDFDQEIDVYDKAGEIVRFLSDWKCQETTLDRCTVALAEAWADREFWSHDDVNLVKAWVKDLMKMGYEFPKLRPNAEIDYPIGLDAEKMMNCRKAHLHVSDDLPRAGANVGAVERAEKKIKDFGELKAWCLAGNSSKANEWFFPSSEELAQATFDNGTLQSNYDTVAIITNNFPWTVGIGFLKRIYEASFGMLIFCGTIPEKLAEDDERVYIGTKFPFSYVHLSDQEVEEGYFMYYCMAKVAEMRLQNVKGYVMFSDDFANNHWNPFDRSEIQITHRLEGDVRWLAPEAYGIPAANRIIALIRDKYHDRPDVVKFMAQYRERLSTLNITNGNKSITDPLDHLNMPDGWSVADWVYLPAENLTFVQTFAELAIEGGLYHELFFSKVAYVLQYDLRDKTGPTGIRYMWGDEDRGNWSEIYTPHYIGLHPIKMSIFTDADNKRKYCDSFLAQVHTNLFGETSNGGGAIVG